MGKLSGSGHHWKVVHCRMRICSATTDMALTLDILRYKPKGARKHGDNASFDGLCKTWCGKHRVKRYETVMFLSVGYDSSFPGHSSSRLPVLRISLEVPAFPFTAEILSNFFTACLGNFSLNFLMMPSKIPTIMRFRLASGLRCRVFFIGGKSHTNSWGEPLVRCQLLLPQGKTHLPPANQWHWEQQSEYAWNMYKDQRGVKNRPSNDFHRQNLLEMSSSRLFTQGTPPPRRHLWGLPKGNLGSAKGTRKCRSPH